MQSDLSNQLILIIVLLLGIIYELKTKHILDAVAEVLSTHKISRIHVLEDSLDVKTYDGRHIVGKIENNRITKDNQNKIVWFLNESHSPKLLIKNKEHNTIDVSIISNDKKVLLSQWLSLKNY